ncbi:hypothetical protein E8P77_30135 [Soehngenia saccharolytica]|nr:hypothetical protein E8P77_30135 [Soehngenia saccharolytica]
MASTTVKITNDNSETAKLVSHHDYDEGHIKGHYPEEIKKGHTIEFVFESKEGIVPGVSSGAVVYKGENEKGKKFDWMYAWYNTSGFEVNVYKAYTEIAKENHVWKWHEVQEKLMKSGTSSHAEYENCVSDASITQQGSATYKGIMSLG